MGFCHSRQTPSNERTNDWTKQACERGTKNEINKHAKVQIKIYDKLSAEFSLCFALSHFLGMCSLSVYIWFFLKRIFAVKRTKFNKTLCGCVCVCTRERPLSKRYQPSTQASLPKKKSIQDRNEAFFCWNVNPRTNAHTHKVWHIIAIWAGFASPYLFIYIILLVEPP